MDQQSDVKVLGPAQRGMSLLETLVSCMVLSIAMTATYSAWITAERLESIAREEAIVHAYISKLMSDIRATPFEQITNSTTNGGFAGGAYGDGTFRLNPGLFKINLGAETAKADINDASLMGLRVSRTPFDGAVRFGNLYAGPGAGIPELRVIIINANNPIESELGEFAGNGDGFDLNQDGVVSATPYPAPTLINDSLMASQVEPLFPRIVSPGTDILSTAYYNVTQMQLLPIVVQVRWWSVAGVPRELSVITFIANRAS